MTLNFAHYVFRWFYIQPKTTYFFLSYSLIDSFMRQFFLWIFSAEKWLFTESQNDIFHVHVHKIRENRCICMRFSCFDPKNPKSSHSQITTPFVLFKFQVNLTYYLNTNIAHKIHYELGFIQNENFKFSLHHPISFYILCSQSLVNCRESFLFLFFLVKCYVNR